MKRLLCILSSLDVGGAETFMMKIFRSLPGEYKIDFVVSSDSGFYEDEVRSLGGKIYRIPLRTKHPLQSFLQLKRIVNVNRYKHIIKLCDTPKGIVDLVAAKAGGAVKICVRSCNAASDSSRVLNIIYTIIRPLFNKLAVIKIAPSKLAAEYTFGKRMVTSNKVVFLHNAIDLDVYKYSEYGRNKIRQEFEILEDAFVVGHIGRFNHQKNHKYLIKVFKEIQEVNKNSYLLLVGEGEKKKEIENQIIEEHLESRVIFAGIRSDIPELLSGMDILVFPSFYEGMPNVIIEAQATGLPCLISDTITKEAAITDLVKYMPINGNIKKWADYCLNVNQRERNLDNKKIKEAGYEIEGVVRQFINLIFGDAQ